MTTKRPPAQREYPRALPSNRRDFLRVPAKPALPSDVYIDYRIAQLQEERNILLAIVVIDTGLAVGLAILGAWVAGSLSLLVWFCAAALLMLKTDKLRSWQSMRNLYREGKCATTAN